MNVTLVVDALSPRLSGIGRYTWELCKRVPEQPGIERTSYFSNGSLLHDPAILLHPGSNPRHKRLLRWLRAPLTKRRLGDSLVHAPNYFLPGEVESGIITVHDLSVFHYPEAHPAERLRHFERDFSSSLRRARHVITDTETVRREIVDHFGLPESRITAIPLGVSHHYRPCADSILRPRLARWGLLPREYALCVSSLEPRKKIEELLSAWRDLPAAIRSSRPLVLAGGEGWLNDSLHEQIREGAAAGWLKHLGFVPESELPALYAGAVLFLYPSIYEGFGLPPIEAMASGIPVIVANGSCMPEVCGGVAAYVEPNDIKEFSTTIVTALSDTEWRNDTREKGLERAAGYSWEKCVERTVRLYQANR